MPKFAAMTVALGLATFVAGPAAADITKCQQGIEKNGQKLQASILKAFTKCKDGFRKAGGDSVAEGTAALSCQGGLNKTLDFGNDGLVISAMEKTKGALDKLVPPLGTTCTDDDLTRLGYLTTALYGDRWERLILLSALKGAYETQAVLVGDFPNIMQSFGGEGCALCATLSTPPCVASLCSLNASSGAVATILGTNFNVPLSGGTVIAGCEWQKVLNDPANNLNEIGLIGTPNIALRPSLIIDNPGTDSDVYACNLTVRSLGILSCGGGSSAPKVSYTTCQDSLIGGGDASGPGDECEAGATSCQDDPDPTTGGPCVTFMTAASADGDIFVVNTTRLRISTDDGPDNIRCSADDTLTDTAPAPIPLTNGTVTATVIDYGNVNGTNKSQGPAIGVAGQTCAQARVGNNAGRTLVGAFPAAEAVPAPSGSLGDSVTKLTLVCN